MTELFRELTKIAVLVFSVSTMLSVGFAHTVQHLFSPMRDTGAVVRALVANFILVPLFAFVLIQLMPLRASHANGLMLFAAAAGAPFLLKLTKVAKGNMALSASLLMLLLPVTVLYMPFVVPLLLPDARVSPIAIGLPLFLTMLLPMGIGLLVRARNQPLAQRLLPWARQIGSIALVGVIAFTTLANFRGLLGIVGEGAIIALVLVIFGAFTVGYLLGRKYRGGDVVLGLGTAQRNIAAAMVVATQGLGDPDAVLMIVIASMVDLAVLFPIAWTLRRGALRRMARA